MSYFVYILLSKKDGKLYVGCTKNVEKRLERHNSGHVIATRQRRPLILIYCEIHASKSDAFQRERFLKSLWGGREKKKILEAYLDSVGRANG